MRYRRSIITLFSIIVTCLYNNSIFVDATTSSAPPPSVYPVDEYIFDSIIDHYNFRPTTVPTFPLRYYVNEEYWNGTAGGPCFFYTGNEADIFQFVNNSGFLFEAAEEFGAMVVFAEHRYYGLSNPFGNENALGIPYNVSFLTVEQAMQDFNLLVLHIRKKWKLSSESAFIAFGGSYGANLAMWLRLKNPNLWAGAIASSATPLKHILRQTNNFARIETEAYGNVSVKCPELVLEGWKDLFRMAKSKNGRNSISKELSLCHTLPNEDAAYDIHGWVSGALETMVQYGYPYPTSFYNPLPGYPFRVTCQEMLKEGTGLGALAAATKVYYNYTGQAGTCFDFDSHILKEAMNHWKRKGDNGRLYEQRMRNNNKKERKSYSVSRSLLGMKEQLNWEESNRAWGYQTCTEVYQPMPTNGVTDFELPYIPNKTSYFLECAESWGGVQPRPDWEEMTFMGDNIGSGSNIFITNGQVDPWRAAGIQKTPKGSNDGSIVVRTIENAAHHLDLRASHPLDPPSVISVRNEEKMMIRKWITEWGERK